MTLIRIWRAGGARPFSKACLVLAKGTSTVNLSNGAPCEGHRLHRAPKDKSPRIVLKEPKAVFVVFFLFFAGGAASFNIRVLTKNGK